MKTKFKKGFTLVELVIVIAVIAILSAVLIPTFSGIIKRAQKSSAMQTATTVRNSYYGEYGDSMETIDDMKGYIIQCNDSIFIVSDNGELVEFEGSLEEAMGIYEYDMGTTYPNNQNSIVYRPTGAVNVDMSTQESGLYKDDVLFITWENLINEDYITIEDYGNGTDFNLIGWNYPLWYNGSTLRLVIDEHIIGMHYDSNFTGASSFNSIYIPNSVNDIDPYLISFLPDLSEIYLEDDNPYFYCDGRKVLYNSYSLITTVKTATLSATDYTILSTVEIGGNETTIECIGNYAFYNCCAFATLTIPATIQSMMQTSFICSHFEGFAISAQSENYRTDGNAIFSRNTLLAFATNSSITSYTISTFFQYGEYWYPTTNINQYAFANCVNLEEITIIDTIRTIGFRAFENCNSLVAIHFETNPSNELSIGSYAFTANAQTDIDTIVYTTTSDIHTAISSADWTGRNVSFRIDTDAGIYDLEGNQLVSWYDLTDDLSITNGTLTLFEYSSDDDYALIIDASVTTIGNGVFSGIEHLKSVSFSGTTITIGEEAFSGSGLTSVSLPANTTLGVSAFENCSITSLVLPSALTTVPESAFAGNPLISLTLNEGLETIGISAFEGTNITSVVIPSSVALIGSNAFRYCDYLVVIQFEHAYSDDLTIGDYAFFATSYIDTTISAYTVPDIHVSIDGYDWANSNRATSVEPELASGLYDIYGNLIYSWEQAVDNGTIDVQQDWETSGLMLQNINYWNQQYKLVIDNSVTALGTNFDFGNMYSVVIPASVVKAYGSLAYNNGLREIIVNPANTYFYYDDDSMALYSRTTLLDISADNTDSSFTIKDHVTIAGINYTITSVAGESFNNNMNFTSVTIPATISNFDTYAAHLLCMGGLETFDIDNQNPYYIFTNNMLFRRYTIGDEDGVQLISIINYRNLTSFTTPETIMDGDDELDVIFCARDTFEGSYNLETLTFQGKIRFKIGVGMYDTTNSVLNYCSSLTTINTVNTTHLYTDGIGLYQANYLIGLAGGYVGDYEILGGYTIDETDYVVNEFARYQLFTNISLTGLTIPSSFTTLRDYSAQDAQTIRRLTIPASVTRIERAAFQNAYNLEEITFLHSANDPLTIIDVAFYTNEFVDTTIIAMKDGSENIGIHPAIYGYAWSASRRNVSYEFMSEAGLYNSSNELVLSWAELIDDENTTPIITLNNDEDTIQSFSYTTDDDFYIVLDNSITTIGANAFSGNTHLTSITLGTSTTTIGASAFAGCTALESVVYLKKVTSIGISAFSGCVSLENAELNATTTIGANAFYNCSALANITLSPNLVSIGASAFENTIISSVELGANVVSIGNRAFYNIPSLTTIKFFSPSDSLLEIGTNAFYYEQESDELLETELKCIAQIAAITDYDWETNDNRDVSYGRPYEAGVYNVDYSECLKTWDELVSEGRVTMDGTILQYLNYYDFGNNFNLVIPEDITQINGIANVDCIRELTIPSTLNATNLVNIFNSWSNNLSKITVDCVVDDGISYSDGYGLYCNSQICLFAKYCGLTSYVIPTSYRIGDTDRNVEQIPLNVMSCQTLTSLTLPAYLSWFGAPSLFSLNNLQHIYVPDYSVRMCNNATGTAIYTYDQYSHCVELSYIVPTLTGIFTVPSEVTISDTDYYVEHIGPQSCMNSRITTMILPDTITEICVQAFQGSTISYITIPSSVENIDGMVFQYCTNFSLITFEHTSTDSITIGEIYLPRLEVFVSENRTALTVKCNPDAPDSIFDYDYDIDNRDVTFVSLLSDGLYNASTGTCEYTWDELDAEHIFTVDSNGVLTAFDFDDYAFTLVLPDTITAIGANVFYENTMIEGITLKSSTASIGASAFEGASNLETINLAYVTTIGARAFANCSLLSSITLSDELTTINPATFYGVNISSVVIPDSVTVIGENAFYGAQNLTTIQFNHELDTIELGLNAFYVDQVDDEPVETDLYVNIPVIGGIDAFDWDANNRHVSTIDVYIPGIYNYATGQLIYTWEQAVDNGIISYENGAVGHIEYNSPFNICLPKTESAFHDNMVSNNNLREVTLPRSATYERYNYDIGYNHWSSSQNITKFNLVGTSGDLYTDGYGLYYQNALIGYAKMSGLTEYEILEETVYNGRRFRIEEIYSYALANTYELTSITIPQYVNTINQCAFMYSPNLTEIIVDEDNDYFYFDGACLYNRNELILGINAYYSDYTTLDTVTINDVDYNVTSIASNALRNSGIPNLTISEGITEIHSFAFAMMFNLIRVEFPESLTLIEYNVADGCNNLSTMIFKNTEDSLEINNNAFITSMNPYIETTIKLNYVLYDTLNSYDWDSSCRTPIFTSLTEAGIYSTTYEPILSWEEMTSGNIVTLSGNEITGFTYNASPFILVLPGYIESIADGSYENDTYSGVFAGNTNLTKIEMPVTLTSIGAYAFYGCTSLSDAVLLNTVSYIGTGAFENCALTKVNIPEDLTEINANVFNGNPITSLFIPSSITQIGSYAFGGNNTIQRIEFGHCSYDELTICENAFKGNTLIEIIVSVYINLDTGKNEEIEDYTWLDSNKDVDWNERLEPGLYRRDNEGNTVELLYTWDDMIDQGLLYDQWGTLHCSYSNSSIPLHFVIHPSVTNCYFWFDNSVQLKEVTLPDNMKKYGGFPNLNEGIQHLNLASTNEYFYTDGGSLYSRDSIVTVLQGAHYNSYTILDSVTIAGVNYTITKIAQGAFGSDGSIQTITIPATINYVGENNFTWCYQLQNFVVANGNPILATSLDGSSLYMKHGDVAKLIKVTNSVSNYVMPDSVTIAGENYPVTTASNEALKSSSLITIELSPNFRWVSTMGNTFNYYSTTAVTIRPNGNTNIYIEDSKAIYADGKIVKLLRSYTGSYKMLDSYQIGDTVYPVTGVVWDAFYETDIESLEFSSNMLSYTDTLQNLDDLRTIIIPASIRTLGSDYNYLFTRFNVDRIVFKHSTNDPLTIGSMAFGSWSSDNINTTVVVYANNYESINSSIKNYDWEGVYRTVTYEYIKSPGIYDDEDNLITSWNNLDKTVEDGIVTYIDVPSSPYKLIVPETITGIGAGLLDGDENIFELVLNAGIETIGNNAFNGCTSLGTINIPSTVTSIGNNAFYNCPISELTLPKTLVTIGSSAFYGSDITSVEFPRTVTSIGASAFAYNDNLTTISFKHQSDDTLTIGAEAFMATSSIETTLVAVKYPNNIIHTNISGYAWSSSHRTGTSEPTVTLPAGLYDTATGNQIYSWANLTSSGYIQTSGTALTNVTIPDNSYYYKLVIDDSITRISTYINGSPENLIEIVLPASLEELGPNYSIGNDRTHSVSLSPMNKNFYTDGTALYSKDGAMVYIVYEPANPDYTMLSSVTIDGSDYDITSIETVDWLDTHLDSFTISENVSYIIDKFFDGFGQYIGALYVDPNNPYFTIADNGLYMIVDENHAKLVNVPYQYIHNTSFVMKNTVTINGDDYIVRYLNNFAFSWCSDLQSIAFSKYLELDTTNFFGSHRLNYLTTLTINGTPEPCCNIYISGNILYADGTAMFGPKGLTGAVHIIPSYTLHEGTEYEVTVPVTNIKHVAFNYDYGITSIYLDRNITTIDQSAFFYCSNVTNVYYTGTESEFNRIILNYYGNEAITNSEITFDYGWDYDNPIAHQDPSCTEFGYTDYVNSNGSVKRVIIAKTPHDFDENDDCTVCGYHKPQTEIIYEASGDYYGFYYNDITSTYTSSTANAEMHETIAQMTIVAHDSINVTINWQVSSEEGCDFLRIYLNDSIQVEISGQYSSQLQLSLSDGDIVYINYEKDVSVDNFDDCAYIQIEFPD